MKKNRSTLHYNEEIRDLTICMFLKGSNNRDIERAIGKKVADFKKQKRGEK